jgi:hypothetical protein
MAPTGSTGANVPRGRRVFVHRERLCVSPVTRLRTFQGAEGSWSSNAHRTMDPHEEWSNCKIWNCMSTRHRYMQWTRDRVLAESLRLRVTKLSVNAPEFVSVSFQPVFSFHFKTHLSFYSTPQLI